MDILREILREILRALAGAAGPWLVRPELVGIRDRLDGLRDRLDALREGFEALPCRRPEDACPTAKERPSDFTERTP